MKNNTRELVASSSVCSKDYLSASSSCKSHSHPHLIYSLSAGCTSKEIQKNTAIQVKDASQISLHFTTKYSLLIKDLLQGQGKPDKRFQWKQEETFRFLTKAVSKRSRCFIENQASLLKSTKHCLPNWSTNPEADLTKWWCSGFSKCKTIPRRNNAGTGQGTGSYLWKWKEEIWSSRSLIPKMFRLHTPSVKHLSSPSK